MVGEKRGKRLACSINMRIIGLTECLLLDVTVQQRLICTAIASQIRLCSADTWCCRRAAVGQRVSSRIPLVGIFFVRRTFLP